MAEKEVRLIDANEVHRLIDKNLDINKGKGCSLSETLVREIVDSTPTIDPESLRTHGLWKKSKDDYCGLNIIKCSLCREEWCFEVDDDVLYLNYHYCPNCGAKMEGGITMSNYCKTCIHNEVCSLTHCDQSIACCDFVSGWISVKDRLPDDSDKIVLVIANGKFGNITLDEAFELACYYKDDGWVLESYPDMENVRVTHWMPLPEPPKEVNHDL